jgi:Icc-related predicted phosphoesterase
LCFKKFLNAGKFYKVDAIILGGDITGKLVVPIVKQPDDTYTCKHAGATYSLRSVDELDQFRKRIENQGFYPFAAERNEIENFRVNKEKVDELFIQLMCRRIEEWVQLADERLRGVSYDCYIQPGNDDRYEIDPLLKKSEKIINPDGKIIQLDRAHEMISTGHANTTPWNCPRDESEEKLAEIVEAMASHVKDMKNCIFNVHCPPYGTHLDIAPKLDETLKPVVDAGGGIKMIAVGSSSVRKAIEAHQPLMGLHGHIHESKGAQHLGRTLILNPGSEYGEGILRGVVIELNDEGIRTHQFVQG